MILKDCCVAVLFNERGIRVEELVIPEPLVEQQPLKQDRRFNDEQRYNFLFISSCSTERCNAKAFKFVTGPGQGAKQAVDMSDV